MQFCFWGLSVSCRWMRLWGSGVALSGLLWGTVVMVSPGLASISLYANGPYQANSAQVDRWQGASQAGCGQVRDQVDNGQWRKEAASIPVRAEAAWAAFIYHLSVSWIFACDVTDIQPGNCGAA